MFIAGPVARNKATASGKVTSALASRTPNPSAARSIAGSVARLDWVEKATACGSNMARAKVASDQRAATPATTYAASRMATPRLEISRT